MIIITGASGQVGSNIVKELKSHGKDVRRVIRNPEKAIKDTECKVADLFNVDQLKEAFKGGSTVFLLTPENPSSKDVIADAKTILNNYKEAIRHSGIKKIVGLSSSGAQHKTGTRYLEVSYMLEHAFEDLPVEQTFIRPAYYYSNWLAYLDTISAYGILPTFFPVDLKIPMIAPTDVAKSVAEILMSNGKSKKVVELTGPDAYSSAEVAEIFGKVLNKKVEAQPIPQQDWKDTLQQAGFSENAADNMIKMTEAVINGKTQNESKHELIRMNTDLESYLRKSVG